MERFNPFASPEPFDQEPTPTAASRIHKLQSAGSRSDSIGSVGSLNRASGSPQRQQVGPTCSADLTATSAASSRYSTSFPDPFAGSHPSASSVAAEPILISAGRFDSKTPGNRSNSVTFAASSHSIEDLPSSTMRHQQATSSPTRARLHERQATTGGGLTSFLSRATSVTSSTVTDRVSGAVGSVRSAVDSISSQIQSAVPANLNERISSATGQFTSSVVGGVGTVATGVVSGAGSSLPVSISRQRVVLIVDDTSNTDWPQQFNAYRRLMSGGSGAGGQSALTSFFSSATAQLTTSGSGSSSSPSMVLGLGGGGGGGGSGGLIASQNSSPNPSTNIICSDGLDLLIEQADFRDVSVLANQITSTATVFINSFGTSSQLNSLKKQTISAPAKIARPEFVVIRQRSREQAEHLRGIVTSLAYCLIPMFEPYEVWNIFQDRQLVFSKLLRVQKALGKENFPLIPQIYCQTHQDLLNYINSSTLTFPCLLRTGPSGKGRLKVDNLQMLRDFSSIVATSGMSCTIEQHLDVKCDLIVQKMGTSLKLFRRLAGQQAQFGSEATSGSFGERQTASRQTSLGSSVISSFMSSASSQQHQQAARKNSGPASNAYEKLSEVSVRYRGWVEAISREFEGALQAFCLKIVVANNDREYIVNLNDCSSNFLGSPENQDEDRRSFVELIISNMNTNLPNGHNNNLSRESSSNVIRRTSGERNSPLTGSRHEAATNYSNEILATTTNQLKDKKKFTSQTHINQLASMPTEPTGLANSVTTRSYGQLSNRSQSVSVNQSDYVMGGSAGASPNRSMLFRRASDKSNEENLDDLSSSYGNSQTNPITASSSSGLNQRQASLGQSIFDQTSTAFSSLQKQSLSFFKRLDARGTGSEVLVGSTPPLSAKSDKAFDKSFLNQLSNNLDDVKTLGGSGGFVQSSNKFSAGANGGFKSQSIDSSALSLSPSSSGGGGGGRIRPPKPPPPNLTGSARQASLASYASSRSPTGTNTTPNTTPNQTRQNSTVGDNSSTSCNQSSQRAKVVRQNSALSAFEPYDPDVAAKLRGDVTGTREVDAAQPVQQVIESESAQTIAQNHPTQTSLESIKRSANFDSASITSGDSNSTGETTNAEDTMNNLKKTFASIFGDRCE